MEAAEKIETNLPVSEPIIPKDWRNSVKAIMELGQLLKEKREQMSPKDFGRWVIVAIGLGDSSAKKLIRIGTHPILSNPKYWDRLPAQWGYLFEACFLKDEILIPAIEDGTLRSQKKFAIWTIRGRERPKYRRKSAMGGARSNVGGKIAIFGEASIIDTVKVAMMREDPSGSNTEALAKELGIGVKTFRNLKTIINAYCMEELTDEDRKRLRHLMDEIERTGNVQRYYDKARPILTKIWGSLGPANKKTGKQAQKRVEDFVTAVTVIRSSCDRAGDLEAPYLSASDTEMVLNDLAEARKSIGKLMSTIRREDHHE